MPLTTPMLTGARVRLTDRDALDLVVPRASGGRGNDLVPWDQVADLCEPGVHDIRLLDRVGRLRVITPAIVREAGLLTLAEGFAGRRARNAAMTAMAADQDARRRTHYHLLLALIRHYDPASQPVPLPQLSSMATQAIGRLAGQFNARPESVADGLRRLSVLFAPLGLGENLGTARIPSLLVSLQAFRRAIDSVPIETDWEAEAVALITRTSAIALACITRALADTRGLAENIAALVGAWIADPAGVAARMNRAEWLADGWMRLCSFCTLAAEYDGQLPALEDIVLMLPTIPDEVAQWPGFGTDTMLPAHHARDRLPEAYSEINWIDAVARNESLLALAA